MYQLPKLPYNYSDLEPYIDALTVEIHYSKHHQNYVNKLNELLASQPDFQNLDLVDLIKNIQSLPENLQTPVFNNAGQVYNHNLYWESLSSTPTNLNPESNLAKKINKTFGSLDEMLAKLVETASTQFGSGWAWLSVDKDGNLVIEKTSNADSPLTSGKEPLLTLDVWEHAYYLKYQNLRPKYLEELVKILNWSVISQKYDILAI